MYVVTVPADRNKPHRCPCCNAICVFGNSHWWNWGHCADCGMRWLLGYRRYRDEDALISRCLAHGSHRGDRITAATLTQVIGLIERYRDLSAGLTYDVLGKLLYDINVRWSSVLADEQGAES